MRRIALGLAVVALAAGAARAQQPEKHDGHQVVSEAQFAALPPASSDGDKFQLLYVRMAKCFGEQLKLHRSPLVDRVVVKDAALRQALEDQSVDSTGARIVPKRSNLQLIGTGQRDPARGAYVLVVTRVVVIESDLAYAQRRAQALAANDAPRRVELARWMHARLRHYYQGSQQEHDAAERRELVAFMRDLEDQAKTIEQQALPALPAGAETRIVFGQKHKALNVLAQVWSHAEVPAPLKAKARHVLEQELRAQLFLGRWYAYEDYKELVEFQKLPSGQWVPRERAAFVAVCEEEKKRIAREKTMVPMLPDGILRQAKKVVKGMRKEIVHGLTQVWPVHTDRLVDSTYVFEQWVLEDGECVYFINGVVFETTEGE